jgi:hypothetical protein
MVGHRQGRSIEEDDTVLATAARDLKEMRGAAPAHHGVPRLFDPAEEDALQASALFGPLGPSAETRLGGTVLMPAAFRGKGSEIAAEIEIEIEVEVDLTPPPSERTIALPSPEAASCGAVPAAPNAHRSRPSPIPAWAVLQRPATTPLPTAFLRMPATLLPSPSRPPSTPAPAPLLPSPSRPPSTPAPAPSQPPARKERATSRLMTAHELVVAGVAILVVGVTAAFLFLHFT